MCARLAENLLYRNRFDEGCFSYMRAYMLAKRYTVHRVLHWKIQIDNSVFYELLGTRLGPNLGRYISAKAMQVGERNLREAKTMGIIASIEAGFRLAVIALGQGVCQKRGQRFRGEVIMRKVAIEATHMGQPMIASDARFMLCSIHLLRLDVDSYSLHCNEAWKTAVVGDCAFLPLISLSFPLSCCRVLIRRPSFLTTQDADDVRRVMQSMGLRL